MGVLTDLQGKIGQQVGMSDWVEIPQERINQFADSTEDHQFIHVDADKAKKFTPFGGTIAHGFLTLSLLSRFAETGVPEVPGSKMVMNYGLNKVRFLAPVPCGAKVRGVFTLMSAEEKKTGQLLLSYGVSVEIDGAPKPVMVAEWLMLIFI